MMATAASNSVIPLAAEAGSISGATAVLATQVDPTKISPVGQATLWALALTATRSDATAMNLRKCLSPGYFSVCPETDH
jgi:hypothetical protein